MKMTTKGQLEGFALLMKRAKKAFTNVQALNDAPCFESLLSVFFAEANDVIGLEEGRKPTKRGFLFYFLYNKGFLKSDAGNQWSRSVGVWSVEVERVRNNEGSFYRYDIS